MTPKVPDYGHRYADKKLVALLRRLRLSYLQASISLQQKIEDYMEQFEKEDAIMRALYDSGELSHEDFLKWRRKAVVETQQWKDMREQLTNDLMNQDRIATDIINDALPEVYAENHNYGTYEAEVGSGIDTTYTMYDKSTVARLLRENQDLLPNYHKPDLDVPKDKLWNRQHIQSAVLQGILTGEPIGDIAKRFQDVVGMDERAAMRNARTAVTGAENAGRIDSYIRAQKMGIKMKQMWMATLDARTRDSHAIMDGEQQEVGKKFSNGCRYPGDPQGAPAEVYNCRCTLVAVVEGADPYNLNLRPSEYLKEQGLTYEHWKEMHGKRFYSKLFKDYDEPKRELSFAEQIASGKLEKLRPEDVFSYGGPEGLRFNNYWGNGDNQDHEVAKRIDQTILQLEKNYPMQARVNDQYNCTTQNVIVTDYSDAWIYLPDGKNDRRYEGDNGFVLGQVFNVERRGVNTSVIGFRRNVLDDDRRFQDVIEHRSSAIANNKVIETLSEHSVEGTTIHEWGHVFANQHMDNAMVHGSENAQAYWEWFKTLTEDEIRTGISDYATTNRGEFEAECFLEMLMPNPRPLAVKWWSFMEKILEEGY